MDNLRFLFEAVFYPSGNGYEVNVPDLGVFTQGDDLMDAAYMAQDLVETYVSMLMEDGDRVPEATYGRKSPDGGYVMLIATDGKVPETEDMSVQDAADILGVSASRVYAMCRDGVLKSHKIGNTVMVYTSSVKERQNSHVRSGRPKKELTTA